MEENNMIEFLLLTTSLIFVAFGLLIFSGKRFMIHKSFVQLFSQYIIFANFTISMMRYGVNGIFDILFICIPILIILIITFFLNKRKYYIYNIDTEELKKYIANFLKCSDIEYELKDNTIIIENSLEKQISFDKDIDDFILNMSDLHDSKVYFGLKNNIKTNLNSLKKERCLLTGIFYMFLGVFLTSIFLLVPKYF
jgi:hypothetical protein